MAGFHDSLTRAVLLPAVMAAAGMACASPTTDPCELVTRDDASQALGVTARPGIASGSDFDPSIPKFTCVYFSPAGFVRVSYQSGGRSGFDAQRRNLGNDVVDIPGVGDAAYYLPSILTAIKGQFYYVVTMHRESPTGNPPNPDDSAPDPALIMLAKQAAARL